MKITQSNKTNKFSISNVTDNELWDLWYACWSTQRDKIADTIVLALAASLDSEDILGEYGYTIDEYIYHAKANYLTFKAKYPCYLVWECWDTRYDRLNDDVLSTVKHEIGRCNDDKLAERLVILDQFSEYRDPTELQLLADYVIKQYY